MTSIEAGRSEDVVKELYGSCAEVVVFGTVDKHGLNDCGQIADIDTATGAVLWHAVLPTGWLDTDLDPSDPAPALAADVVVAEEPHGLRAFLRSDGMLAWTYSPPSPSCIVEAVSGTGDRVVAATRCPGSAGQLVSLDAHSGSLLWAAALPVTEADSGRSYAEKIISAAPPVVAVYSPGAVDEWGQVRSYDGAGHLQATFPTAGLELTEEEPMPLPSSARVIGTTLMEQDSSGLGPGHARLLRMSPSDGRSSVSESYSPHALSDDGQALFVADGSGLFAIDAQATDSPTASGSSASSTHAASQTAVVRIR